MSARVTTLWRYPVKGFSPDTLAAVDLVPGETMPFDRAYAVENGPSGFDPAAPVHMPKIKFLCLMRNEGLARLATRFDPETTLFTIAEAGATLAEGRLDTEEGRTAIETFLAARFADVLRGPPKVLRASGHSFSDVAKKVLHLVNRETVRALGAELGVTLAPLRFRPNLVVDGLAPGAELGWPRDMPLSIGGIDFEVVKRTERCAATNVDPATGLRDLQIPRHLMQTVGHADCGVYLRVLSPGRLAVGDELAV
ncbi:MOSC domain-containing protein [Pinisolibacter aquiterrae]|uniref:MOSC domain-containing protein n=1 Tax=Pinisolibacter aquiterrae TaxID=2815579 RepID=UPI001C3DE98B|nr:MOSC domain-containing protein [Pinisolibacter aquiterrae]MBV5262889.1 MOSC domain-containing protein [Pinisolibacter aquiterrae]MCC8236396.1 MOSC domain-containing protein [Pinisolibacter aquiterrae]